MTTCCRVDSDVTDDTDVVIVPALCHISIWIAKRVFKKKAQRQAENGFTDKSPDGIIISVVVKREQDCIISEHDDDEREIKEKSDNTIIAVVITHNKL